MTVKPIQVEGKRLAKALSHANRLVFDYADNNVLLLRGAYDFAYAIIGRRE